MASEDQLIGRILRKFPPPKGRLRIGIGDDAAVIHGGGGMEWVATTDAFLEDVHFKRSLHPARSVGYKSLARATSDLAAMGAQPYCFLLTLALPASCIGKWLDEFLEGLAVAARKLGLVLAGGDTTKYPKILVSLTVMGEIRSGRAILRSGARPGELIYVSGRLGEAELGLRLMLQRGTMPGRPKLLKKHLYPEPRLALGRWLSQKGVATAMIDTSDGLSTDLGHLCRASGVGARVYADTLPAVSLPRELKQRGIDPMNLALHGGEDYELLFTVPKARARHLPRSLAGTPVTIIGEITRAREIVLVYADGRATPLRPGGWDPFR